MKTLAFFLLSTISLYGQSQWSDVVGISPDTVEAINPSIAESWNWESNGIELLAYTQIERGQSDVVVLTTNYQADAWMPFPSRVTNDTIRDDNPALVWFTPRNERPRMMIAWERGLNDIYFSYTFDSVWVNPAPIGTGAFGGKHPRLAASDSGVGAVWENGGRILFSEFRNNVWSTPLFLTSAGDTVNFSPQIKYYRDRPKTMVVWECRMGSSTDRSIAYSARADSEWTLLDTITSIGNNRNPRFVKPLDFRQISFESNRRGDYDIFDATLTGSSWVVQLHPFSISGQHETNASFTRIPMITVSMQEPIPLYLSYTAGAWRRSSQTGMDSIVLGVWEWFSDLNVRSAGAAENRNPVICPGVGHVGGWRVWALWESNVGGRWKLYGSVRNVPIASVDESLEARAFRLHQNYPNPFNPSTTILFELDHPSHVTLSVLDLLGKEVVTLLDERKDSGFHKVEVRSNSLSTGIYFYRLVVNGYEKVRKMMLLK